MNLSATKEPVKEAITPSVAECLRAVFAAFLWHEGIVHDAMACASFLKFHPGLPKQGALVITRQASGVTGNLTAAEKIKQRHSVEVSASNYLHIQPSTLETLTRSAANANANRSRKKHDSAGVTNNATNNAIKEEEGNMAHSTTSAELGATSAMQTGRF
jgi:E3 ubiquitin-protein ligase MYCBP2